MIYQIRYNAGLDESNHGGIPEHFVIAYSQYSKDIRIINGLSKKGWGIKKIEFLLREERDFRYITINRKFRKKFTDRGIQVIVLSEFIKNIKGLNAIYFDGELRSSTIEEVKKVIYPRECPRIEPIIKGDQKVPIINMAHHIARELYKNHNEKRGSPYPEKRIKNFSLEDYVMLTRNHTFGRNQLYR